MVNISAVIITFNEERRIRATLQALDFCNEIVVVDSGSTDNTVAICKEFNCTVFTRPFDGYGTQKMYAVSKASNDWVLALDADEVVSHELKQEIVSVLKKDPGGVTGFYLPISLVFLGKLLRHGGEYKKRHLRLFSRSAGTFTNDAVHEHAEIAGQKANLSHHILHYSYDSISDYLQKFNSYTSAAADALFAKNRTVSALSTALRFPLVFFRIYIIRGCLFDGFPGFLWSLFSSLYPVVKFSKLLEKQAARR